MLGRDERDRTQVPGSRGATCPGAACRGHAPAPPGCRCAPATSTRPGADLAQAGLALRVRKEGRRWVQTLKGAGDGIWQRLEHEVVLNAPARWVPAVDPALHDGTPAGEALRQALGEGALLPTYGTEVTRTQRLLRARGCLVELAFDHGRAGGGRPALAAVRARIRTQGWRRRGAGRAGGALGSALRPDAGHPHQGRARRPPLTRRAPGRAGEGPAAGPARGRGQPRRTARGGRQLPAAGAGQCQRDRPRGRHTARTSAPAARGPAPAAHGAARTGCLVAAGRCRVGRVAGPPLRPAGHRAGS